MESDLPVPIDDSLPFVQQEIQPESETSQRYYHQQQPEPRYYYEPMIPPQVEQVQKKDIFSELNRTHWIIIISAILLAFFMGKSIATPIILRSI
jgi:hypothetical protein